MSFKYLSILPSVVCFGCSLPPEAAQLQGTWLSDGYGLAADIKDGRVTSYAVANKTCLDDGTDPLFGVLQVFDVEVAPDSQSFLLRQQGTAQAIRFDRVIGVPAACATPPRNTPLGNFDAFVDIFETHYAFFDTYGVDWAARTANARGRVTATTTDTDLFAILSELLTPLRDGHIGLKARIDGDRFLYEPNPARCLHRCKAKQKRRGHHLRMPKMLCGIDTGRTTSRNTF